MPFRRWISKLLRLEVSILSITGIFDSHRTDWSQVSTRETLSAGIGGMTMAIVDIAYGILADGY
jgi:hypothetical protein